MKWNQLFSTFIGSAICGALVFGIWPEMWKSYGIMGGGLVDLIGSTGANLFGYNQ